MKEGHEALNRVLILLVITIEFNFAKLFYFSGEAQQVFDVLKTVKAKRLAEFAHSAFIRSISLAYDNNGIAQLLGWVINKHAPILPVKRAVFVGVCGA